MSHNTKHWHFVDDANYMFAIAIAIDTDTAHRVQIKQMLAFQWIQSRPQLL